MGILRDLSSRIEAKKRLARSAGLVYDTGLTLIEVAAAIGVSIILALVLVMAMTGLFSSAKHSSVVQTLTNISTAAFSYGEAEGDPTQTPNFGPTALSEDYPGVVFITAAPSSSTGADIYHGVFSGVDIFAAYDPSTANCVYTADQFLNDPETPWSTPGVWWSAPGGAPCSYISGGSLLTLTDLYYDVRWSKTPPAN